MRVREVRVGCFWFDEVGTVESDAFITPSANDELLFRLLADYEESLSLPHTHPYTFYLLFLANQTIFTNPVLTTRSRRQTKISWNNVSRHICLTADPQKTRRFFKDLFVQKQKNPRKKNERNFLSSKLSLYSDLAHGS